MRARISRSLSVLIAVILLSSCSAAVIVLMPMATTLAKLAGLISGEQSESITEEDIYDAYIDFTNDARKEWFSLDERILGGFEEDIKESNGRVMWNILDKPKLLAFILESRDANGLITGSVSVSEIISAINAFVCYTAEFDTVEIETAVIGSDGSAVIGEDGEPETTVLVFSRVTVTYSETDDPAAALGLDKDAEGMAKFTAAVIEEIIRKRG